MLQGVQPNSSKMRRDNGFYIREQPEKIKLEINSKKEVDENQVGTRTVLVT